MEEKAKRGAKNKVHDLSFTNQVLCAAVRESQDEVREAVLLRTLWRVRHAVVPPLPDTLLQIRPLETLGPRHLNHVQ